MEISGPHPMRASPSTAFMASERREQPTYAVILTLISHTVWLKIAGCPSLGFTYIAQATRFAQAQGARSDE